MHPIGSDHWLWNSIHYIQKQCLALTRLLPTECHSSNTESHHKDASSMIGCCSPPSLRPSLQADLQSSSYEIALEDDEQSMLLGRNTAVENLQKNADCQMEYEILSHSVYLSAWSPQDGGNVPCVFELPESLGASISWSTCTCRYPNRPLPTNNVGNSATFLYEWRLSIWLYLNELFR